VSAFPSPEDGNKSRKEETLFLRDVIHLPVAQAEPDAHVSIPDEKAGDHPDAITL
jgi:hypothetical protein